VNLYDYQQKVVAEYEAKIAAGIRRPLIAAATGSGKTVIASEIVRREVARSKRVVFLAHRDELLTQARRKLSRFGITAGIIKAGRDNDARPQSLVQICGIQTLHARAIRRQTIELPPAEIVIIDEAHHARAQTYEQIVAAYPDAISIGLTATPCRTDGRGLGNIFDAIIEAPQVPELIKLKKLVPAKIFAPAPPDLRGVETAATGDYVISQLEQRMNTDPLVGDIVEHWLRHSERRRTVGFAVDVAHSVHITRELVKSGVRAEHLDGATKQDEREAILCRLASGETEFVCNCQVLTEGFDLPDLGCIVLVRPTKSLLLYRQMIGRGLRTAPDKKDCIILDHAGAVHRHGLPTDPIEWTLHTDKRAANKTHESRKSEYNNDPFCECKKCGHLRQKGFACDNCGYQPKPHGEGIDYIDDHLIEIGQTQRRELDRQTFYAELRGFQATARKKDGSPYKSSWAANQYKDKHGIYPPWIWNNHAPLPPTPATLRWIQHRRIAFANRRAVA
jgi:DNA repair protein RadD